MVFIWNPTVCEPSRWFSSETQLFVSPQDGLHLITQLFLSAQDGFHLKPYCLWALKMVFIWNPTVCERSGWFSSQTLLFVSAQDGFHLITQLFVSPQDGFHLKPYCLWALRMGFIWNPTVCEPSRWFSFETLLFVSAQDGFHLITLLFCTVTFTKRRFSRCAFLVISTLFMDEWKQVLINIL